MEETLPDFSRHILQNPAQNLVELVELLDFRCFILGAPQVSVDSSSVPSTFESQPKTSSADCPSGATVHDAQYWLQRNKSSFPTWRGFDANRFALEFIVSKGKCAAGFCV